jgi:UDP-N-acetylmuramate dehydrogenase
MNWQKSLRGKLKTNEQLARHTSFKIGGPVQFWFEPKDLSDLQNLVNSVCKKRMPLRIIGAGSNTLVDDKGIKGIVVKLNSPCFKRITVNPAPSTGQRRIKARRGGVNQQLIGAGAGLSLARLLRCAQMHGLSGLELLAGIPGTVGGALIMNAGDIGDRVLDVTVMDKQARVKVLKRKDIRFGYRSSNLGRYIILNAHFKLIKKDKRAIAKSINNYLDYRQKTQDLSRPSAGCFFKNPNLKSVLRLNSGLMVSPSTGSGSSRVKSRGDVKQSILRLRFLRQVVRQAHHAANHAEQSRGTQDASSFDRLRTNTERSRMCSKDTEQSRSAGQVVSPSTGSGSSRAKSRDEVEPSAAYFIERAGLQGSSIGDAAVSSKHANFIINKGRASFADILRLKAYITRCVKIKFNSDLKPEIKIWRD